MKKFTIKFLLYLSPLLLYTLICEYKFFVYKETVSVNKVIESQLSSKNEKYYFRTFFNNSPSLYKLKMAQKKNADILIIGQSTVLQFRDIMFHPLESSFYNMGFSINNMTDLGSLFQLIQTGKLHKPKLIVVGLDISLIKKTLDVSASNEILNPEKDEIWDPRYHVMASQLLVKSLFVPQDEVTPSKHDLGFGYLGDKGTGFRRDGSFHNGDNIAKFIKNPVFTDRGDYKKMVTDRTYIFTEPFELDRRLVEEFIVNIIELKRSGIEVIVFMPPISDDFYSYFGKYEKFSHFFNEYLDVQKLLAANKIELIKFTTPKSSGLSDLYMLDAIHPGEVLVGRLLYNYLLHNKQSGILKSVDTSHLQKMIFSEKNIPLSFMRDSLVFN